MSSPRLSTAIFASLTHPPRPWHLTRILHSDNPLDLHGELRGTASFTPLPPPPSSTATPTTDIQYHEEGEMPSPPGMSTTVGLRFTKKYIWRLNDAGRISVWFAKIANDQEPDYLFHEFDFDAPEKTSATEDTVTPPTPPDVSVGEAGSVVVTARGSHLCINDLYRTAYAFRVRPDGTVLSWASRHVVKGPKKNQDIVNLYSPSV